MATFTITPIKTFVSGENVTPVKLSRLAQSNVALTAGSIVAADIASDAVTTAKILDGNVTTAKILDGNVTTAKLATVTQQSLLPAGAVMPFAMNSAPAGWLAANGDIVPDGSGTVQGVTANFSALYAAVGGSFGAYTGTLPDLRGFFVRGSGGQTYGGVTYNKAFALKEQDGIREHYHQIRFSSIAISGGAGALLDGAGPGSYNVGMYPGTAADETRPANIALLYCIKF